MGTDVKAWADSFRKLTDSDKTIQADEKQVEALFTKLGEISAITLNNLEVVRHLSDSA